MCLFLKFTILGLYFGCVFIIHLNFTLFAATLRVLRHVVGLSTHAVCMAEFSSNAYDVSVTA